MSIQKIGSKIKYVILVVRNNIVQDNETFMIPGRILKSNVYNMLNFSKYLKIARFKSSHIVAGLHY